MKCYATFSIEASASNNSTAVSCILIFLQMVSELITSLENVIHENRISQKELYKLPPLQKTKNTMFHTVETPATDTICKHEENGNLNNFFTPEYIKMLPSFSFSKQYNRSNSTFYLQKSLSKGMLTDEKRDSESSKESFLPRLRNIGLDFAPTDEKQLTVLSSVVSGKHLISLLPEAKIKYKFRKNQISTKRFHFGASNSDSEVCETQHDPTSKPQRHLLTTGMALPSTVNACFKMF
ncbi:uncharacterized protein LOC122795828 [Protopterus annectens]|uniref:uncharacterized protein LOC122795828 n=1 Tax=Protopterus annectens TaxID=7888 RepID=UPI001CFA000F|nr:uncharacterized protein LOC122795828 [Protopterus annectens]